MDPIGFSHKVGMGNAKDITTRQSLTPIISMTQALQRRQDMLTLDGSSGGGQLLRSSLTLSMTTGKPFRLRNIRAKRSKPGLQRQHLTCVQAAGKISGAIVEGAEMGSTELTFQPSMIQSGNYHFAIGTAGSTSLVLQTLLPALMTSGGTSSLFISGGTHNPAAPSFDFLAQSYLPALERIGCNATVELKQAGFFPAGGGAIQVNIQPSGEFYPLDLLDRGALKNHGCFTRTALLPKSLSRRELSLAAESLNIAGEDIVSYRHDDGNGPGNCLTIWYCYENVTAHFTGIADRSQTGDRAASEAVHQARNYLKTDAPVCPFLADQLLLPLVLGSGGRFKTSQITDHFTTNAELIRQFLNCRIETEKTVTDSWLVTVEPKKK